MPKLKLFKNQAEYIPYNPTRRAPVRCVLVGGRPEYGNVKRLPEKLWMEWGIAVVAHIPPSVKCSPNAASFDADIAIVLIDMVSHTLSEWSKSLDVEHNIYVPAGWSKITEALRDCDVTRVPGNAYSKPKRNPVASTPGWKDALKNVPTAIPTPRTPEQDVPSPSSPPEAPVAAPSEPERQEAAAKAAAPLDQAAPSISDVLVELKRAMRDEGVQGVAATLMRDGTLTVELRKVVITTESLEV